MRQEITGSGGKTYTTAGSFSNDYLHKGYPIIFLLTAINLMQVVQPILISNGSNLNFTFRASVSDLMKISGL